MDVEPRIAQIYKLCGNEEKTLKYAKLSIKTFEDIITNPKISPQLQTYLEYEIQGRFDQGPYNALANTYAMIGDYESAISKLTELNNRMEPYLASAQQYSSQQEVFNIRVRQELNLLKMDMYTVDRLVEDDDLDNAVAELNRIQEKFADNEYSTYLMQQIQQRKAIIEMQRAGIVLGNNTFFMN